MHEGNRPGWLVKMQDSDGSAEKRLSDLLREYYRKFGSTVPMMELMGVPEDELLKYIRCSIDSGTPICVDMPPGSVA